MLNAQLPIAIKKQDNNVKFFLKNDAIKSK